jgi:hypothetical protein
MEGVIGVPNNGDWVSIVQLYLKDQDRLEPLIVGKGKDTPHRIILEDALTQRGIPFDRENGSYAGRSLPLLKGEKYEVPGMGDCMYFQGTHFFSNRSDEFDKGVDSTHLEDMITTYPGFRYEMI